MASDGGLGQTEVTLEESTASEGKVDLSQVTLEGRTASDRPLGQSDISLEEDKDSQIGVTLEGSTPSEGG